VSWCTHDTTPSRKKDNLLGQFCLVQNLSRLLLLTFLFE
jgi:hypothetical protein